MKKIISSTYYALVYEFIVVPLLCFVSFLVYENLAYTDLVRSNFLIYILLLALLVAFNIAVIYAIAFLYNKVYKVSLNCYTIIGILTIGIVIWFKVFWYVMEVVNCYEINNDHCVSSIKSNKLSSYVLIASISYFLIYNVLHRMIAKKIKLKKNKEK